MFLASFLLACMLFGVAFAEATLGNTGEALIWLTGAGAMLAGHLSLALIERRRWNRRGVRR